METSAFAVTRERAAISHRCGGQFITPEMSRTGTKDLGRRALCIPFRSIGVHFVLPPLSSQHSTVGIVLKVHGRRIRESTASSLLAREREVA